MNPQENFVKEKTAHGHTVLRWLSDTPMSAQALSARVDQEIGAAARFHTCDTGNLSLDELLNLLISRKKLTEVNGVLFSDPSKMCGHDD